MAESTRCGDATRGWSCQLPSGHLGDHEHVSENGWRHSWPSTDQPRRGLLPADRGGVMTKLRYHGAVRSQGEYEVRCEEVTLGFIERQWSPRGWYWRRVASSTWNGPFKRMRDAGAALAAALPTDGRSA